MAFGSQQSCDSAETLTISDNSPSGLGEAGRNTPTIRQLIDERSARIRANRLALAAETDRETVTLSDNSPRKAGHPGEEGSRRQTQPTPPDADVFERIIGQSTGLRQDFPKLIPSKPYCADHLADGLQIRRKAIALQRRHLQLNGPASFQWMTHDIDRPGAYFAHDDANLPPPNVIMVNPDNGYAHAAYLMASPVARHNAARIEPLRYYASCERGVGRRLEADRCYTGLIAKNPVHTDWQVEWRREEPYTLHEIEGHLFERDMRPDPSIETTFGAGRNVTVFDELRAIAYREVRQFKWCGDNFDAWRDRCVKLALGLNMQFPRALKISEVRAIAKSVAKWTWRHFSVEKFIARQSHLGKRGMASRWAGHVSAQSLKPWESMGISRATYYRRIRERQVDEASTTTTKLAPTIGNPLRRQSSPVPPG